MDATTRYDGLLAAMPVPVVVGLLAGWLSAVPTPLAVGLGSALAGVVVALSLFVVPPE